MLPRTPPQIIIKKHLQQLSQINQPVAISDLIVSTHTSDNKGQGECSETAKHPLKSQKGRMLEQIRMFIDIAMQYHNHHHLIKTKDGKWQCKPDALNKVTRLVTSEFLFYTSKPMSFEKFNERVAAIEELAKSAHENVILIFSSFAVKKGSELFNIVLHVQCGEKPVIKLTTKSVPSNIDPTYENKFSLFRKHLKHKNPAGSYTSMLSGESSDQSIPYQPVIFSKTAGGAVFGTLIDICYDHDRAPAKKSCEEMLDLAIKTSSPTLLPDQVSQVLTSNHIGIEVKNCITNIVTHADRCTPGLFRVAKEKKLTQKKLAKNFLKLTAPEIFNTKLKTDKDSQIIASPPFGLCEYKISAFDERPAEKFPDAFKTKIDAVNEAVIKNRLAGFKIGAHQFRRFFAEEKKRVSLLPARGKRGNGSIETSPEEPKAKRRRS